MERKLIRTLMDESPVFWKMPRFVDFLSALIHFCVLKYVLSRQQRMFSIFQKVISSVRYMCLYFSGLGIFLTIDEAHQSDANSLPTRARIRI